MSAKAWIVIAGILGAVAVSMGAFGAHGLPGYLENQNLESASAQRRIEALETGVRYHVYHTLAILALAILQIHLQTRIASTANWLFLIGIILFSGCLYVYSWTGVRTFAMIVPIGGVAYIAGWVALSVAGIRIK